MMTQTNTARPIYVRAAVKPWKILNGMIKRVANKFGDRAREVERFLKFVVVGVIGTIVDFGTLFVLQATVLAPTAPHENLKVVIAPSIAFMAAITSNFIWNRFWTYPDSRSRSLRRQMAMFTVINTVGLGIRIGWVHATYLTIGTALLPTFVNVVQRVLPTYVPAPEADVKLGTMVASLISVAFVMLWNFFVNRYWTYNDVK